MRGDRRGFVLVTTLLILVVLAALSAATHLMATTNLDVARNARAAAEAQYAASEGLDLALLAIARTYQVRGDGTFPDDVLATVRERLPDDGPYAVVELEVSGSDGFVAVVGQGPGSARHRTSARFEGRRSPGDDGGETNPIFSTGWVTQGNITIRGRTDFQVPLWAAGEVTANATRILADAGLFARSGRDAVGGPLDCRLFSGGRPGTYVPCTEGADAPDDERFDFDAARDEIASTCTTTIQGTGTVNASAYAPGEVVCLGPSADVTVFGQARGLTVVGPDSATVELDARSANADVGDEAFGLRLAAGTIRPGGDLALTGVNTLYAANDVRFESSGYGVTGEGEGADATIGTVIATEGSVLFQGGTSGTYAGVVWTNGHVCKIGGGGLNFRGSIVAGGEGDVPASACDEGIYWNGGGGGTFGAVTNPDLPTTGGSGGSGGSFTAAGIAVTARRP